jgi:hypothetical protein
MEGELETEFEIPAIRTAFRAQWVNGSPACMPEFLMSSNFFPSHNTFTAFFWMNFKTVSSLDA